MKFFSKSFIYLILLFSGLFIQSCSEKDPVSDTDPDISSNSPNIIVIIADDMGWDVFGDYPGVTGTKATTPTINSLASEGLTFTNYWVNPVCAPTRAAMLTGKYGFRTGVGGVQTPQEVNLSNSETIIQNYINSNTSNEYATALIGKWHLSSSDQLTAPENFGIDYFSGILGGTLSDYYNWTQTKSGSQQTITTYATTQFVNESITWIQDQTKPFFLWLAFNAPHTPFHRPPLDLITDQALSSNQATINANPSPYFRAAIEAMDKEISRLLSSLSDAQRENTIIIFMSDNGTPLQVSQAPFRANGTKGKLFQGGINMPLIVSGKGISRTNTTETALVQGPDLFATLADIAGTGTTEYQDGITFKPLFSDANAAKRTYIYSEQFGSTSPINDGYTLRDDLYKLIHLENGNEYLFKVSTDPFEQTNLLESTLSAEAQEHLDQLRQYKTEL